MVNCLWPEVFLCIPIYLLNSEFGLIKGSSSLPQIYTFPAFVLSTNKANNVAITYFTGTGYKNLHVLRNNMLPKNESILLGVEH